MKLDTTHNTLSCLKNTRVLAATAASILLLASGTETAIGCDEEESAPKRKIGVIAPGRMPGDVPAILAPPLAEPAIPGTPPVAAISAFSANVPAIAAAPVPAGSATIELLPSPDIAAYRISHSGGSIEERLERVERMLEELMRDKPGQKYGLYTPAPQHGATPLPPTQPRAGLVKPRIALSPEAIHREAEAHAKAPEKQIEEIERQIEKLEADQERIESEADLLEEREEARHEEKAEEHSEGTKEVQEPRKIQR